MQLKFLKIINLIFVIVIIFLGSYFFCPKLSSKPTSSTQAMDRIKLPPLKQEFFSPQKKYSFVISTLDKWQTEKARGQLYQLTGNNRKLLWSKQLPHIYSPRFVFLGDKGDILLLDEWINQPTSYAIILLDKNNKTMLHYSFNSLAILLQTSPDKLAANAKYGTWIMAIPQWDALGKTVVVETFNKTLKIDLENGTLIVK
jgi:hypothetical protein